MRDYGPWTGDWGMSIEQEVAEAAEEQEEAEIDLGYTFKG
jgi:hypothetical protein